MSIDPSDINDGASDGVSQLLARGAAESLRADRRLAAATDDFFLRDDARLDDRVRAALGNRLAEIVDAIEREIRQFAGRLLIGRDEPIAAHRLVSDPPTAFATLYATGLLRDADLMRELLGRVRQDVLGEALPVSAPDDSDTPSLLPRLAGHADGVIAAATIALMSAEARRASVQPGGVVCNELPAEVHHRLAWLVAAALREQLGKDATPPVDRALSEAALRSLAAHDEGDRLEAVAMRLASALAPHPNELPGYLLEALGNRRIALFVALLAQTLGCGYDVARDIVLDPLADRLWLALRAAALERPVIARIGLALCEADPRRNVETFADQLDDIMVIDPVAARSALAPLSFHPDLRQALMLLGEARRA